MKMKWPVLFLKLSGKTTNYQAGRAWELVGQNSRVFMNQTGS